MGRVVKCVDELSIAAAENGSLEAFWFGGEKEIIG